MLVNEKLLELAREILSRVETGNITSLLACGTHSDGESEFAVISIAKGTPMDLVIAALEDLSNGLVESLKKEGVTKKPFDS